MRWPDPFASISGHDQLRDLAAQFATTASRHDHDGSFPVENYRALHRVGYLTRSIPSQFGGIGDSLTNLCRLQALIASGEPSTALATAMHLQFMGRIGQAIVDGDASEAGGWDDARYRHVAAAVATQGVLINSAATEPEIGSPSRGGRPATTARRLSDGTFVIAGRKTWTTGSPLLRFIVVSATYGPDDDTAGLAQFLIDRGPLAVDGTFADPPGLAIIETWDAMGMRASGSHDLQMTNLCVPASALISYRSFSPRGGALIGELEITPPPSATAGAGWALLVPAVYLGIAYAARDEAINFARNRRPEPMGGAAIGSLPTVQRTLGEIELLLTQAEATLFGAATAWEFTPSAGRPALGGLLAAAKYTATNHAVAIADLAMRVVGGAGLMRSQAIQRHYRNVRAGLHHPPMDDVALTTLARTALTAGDHGAVPA